MANFTALKTAIQNAIKQNGNEEITGDVLQQILLSIVSTMGDSAINTIEQNLSSETLARQGADNTLQQNINSEAGARQSADNTLQSHIDSEALARGNADTQLQNAINAIKANIDNGYVYAGIATPSSTPVSGKVFYIATAAGTYTNFGGQVLTQGINILRYNGSAWSSQQLIGIDDVPTAGSNNLAKSGGVQNELALGAVYDVSAKNPTAGPNNDGKWESLAALLSDANLNTLIPAAYRKGGMSIKFVHTSDNKYVQYRLTASEFTTDITAWVDEDNLSLHTIESNESLNFADENGNVVLNVKDGHVRTKKFDSRAVVSKSDLLELSDREKQDAESLTAAVNGKQDNADVKESEESLNFADENDNVVLRVKNGEIRTRRFDSTTVASKYDVLALSQQLKQETQSLQNAIDGKQNAGNYVEEEIGRDATKLYFKDEGGNVVAEFAGGEILTKHFNSKSALVSKGESQNLNLIDSFGNVILSIKNGYIATSNFKSKGLSTLLNSLLGRIMNIEKDDVLLNRKMIPAISWVDDDFATESAKIGCLTIYRNWCNSNNIHGDIALIPDAVVDRQNQDISRVYFTDDRKALLEAFENEGFEFLVHPPHDGLYTGGGWNTQWSDEYIRKNFAMTVRCFLENNLVPDILVYPGASGGVTEVIKCAKKYFTCAIQPSGGAVGIPTNRYNLKRVNMDNISAERTVTQIKQEIASAISNGYWVILCSHVWMCTGDGTEATDETSMSFANLFDIVTYANTLSAIKPVRQVWRDRSILWDYYTNIN